MPDLGRLDPAAFAALAAELQAQSDTEVTGSTVVKRLTEWVEDADDASLTVRRGDEWQTLAATGELAEEADRLQYELGEGPCRDAAVHTSWLRSGDVAVDERWPRWGPRAARVGVGSLLSLPLLGERGPDSALNVYSRARDAFDDRDVLDQCLVYAVHAANALAAARTEEDLHTALTSRHTIGMAQGMVMERYGLGQQQSFELLRRLSSTTNTKLRDVAAAIVDTGRLPEPPTPPDASRDPG